MFNPDFELFRKANKKTQTEFAEYFSCTQGFISQIELGKRQIPDDMIEKIIADNSLKGKEYVIESKENNNNQPLFRMSSNSNYKILPLLNLDAVGGIYNDEVDVAEYVVGYIPFKDAMDGDICIPVTNDSMNKSYPPGSFVHLRKIDNWKEFIETGQDYVLVLSDRRRLIKRVKKGPDKEHFTLVSENEKYDPVEVNKNFISQIWMVLANYNKRVM